ncbi:hypothetical protein C8R43DRAFT_1137917 [Mycena crocata]|nr:hypothetical protein C8R43DRAFT_1137917 [Mycena crocata]
MAGMLYYFTPDVGPTDTCRKCGIDFATVLARAGRILKCDQWTCDGFARCAKCCLEGHKLDPLHKVQEWVMNRYWRIVSLSDAGLILQLGHDDAVCPSPDDVIFSTPVITAGGMCRLSYRYCRCGISESGVAGRKLQWENNPFFWIAVWMNENGNPDWCITPAMRDMAGVFGLAWADDVD